MTDVNELEQRAAKIAELRTQEAEMSAKKKLLSDELARLEGEYLDLLKENGIKSYHAACGTLTLVHKTSVKVPQDLESKQKFFDFLRERNLFDQMVSVNSQTLNAFYRAELEAARQAGQVDFTLPGIGEPTILETISFRRS